MPRLTDPLGWPSLALASVSNSLSRGVILGMRQVAFEHLHRFHPYCARFPSDLVEGFIAQYTKIGDSVFDPFCGSGTTLVASLVHKRKCTGTDIDILAGMLSELKCFPLSTKQYAGWRTGFIMRLAVLFGEIKRAWRSGTRLRPGSVWLLKSGELSIPAFPQLNYWFPPQLTVALAAIAEAARRCRVPDYERTALISLSASIISKWPATLSYAKDIDHTRPHRKIQRFILDRVLQTYVRRLDRTISCLGALHEVYRTAGVLSTLHKHAKVLYSHDARHPHPLVHEESQALVMTSPPYFNAVDYPRAHRMSICWMNGYAPARLASRSEYIGLRYGADFDPDDWLKLRSGVRRLIPSNILDDISLKKRLCVFFSDLEAVLGQTWRILRPEGHAVFVIANNVIKDQRLESHRILLRLAKIIGFEEIAVSHREIARLRRRFPIGPFGFDGPMTHEYVVVVRKNMT